jgi:transcriptional regulator with PAS, ATPase and Fis domain
MKKLQKHSWPGNVRELQHAIERSLIMSDGDVLEPHDFMFLTDKTSNNEPEETSEPDLTEFDLETVEKMMIQKAVSKYAGNISKAAKSLGLTRASLYRRLEKHGL